MFQERFGELDHHGEIRIDDVADAHCPGLGEDLPAFPLFEPMLVRQPIEHFDLGESNRVDERMESARRRQVFPVLQPRPFELSVLV